MDVKIDVPSYECADVGEVPYLDASAVLDDNGSSLSIFCVNRSREVMELDLKAAGFEALAAVEHVELRHDDLKATNTAASPCRVEPRGLPAVETPRLAPLSYNLLRYAVGIARR
jgi:alpha-N-arabinofuranosidase